MRRRFPKATKRFTAREIAFAAIWIFPLVTVFAASALAVDSECRKPKRVPDPYPASGNVVRFCTPSEDADGHPLPDGSLRSCEVVVDGHEPVVVPVSDPATVVVVKIPEDVKHVKAIDVHCTSADGDKGLSLEALATFRNAAPGRPVLLIPAGEE